MKAKNYTLAMAIASALACATFNAHAAERANSDKSQKSIDRAEVEKITANWPPQPRLGANEMMAKYGPPQEATSERLVWHNPGPYKRITVLNLETPHDFPMPHVDFLEHTISYDVPLNKVADLIAFDGSSTINRTTGELSARCDLEGHNILTFNLDHDIITGKKTVAEARTAFGDNVVEEVKGNHPAYVEQLQFQPQGKDARFSDKPVIPGAPRRPGQDGADTGKAMSDAEVLASVVAIDMNEVLAAAQAEKKKLNSAVLDYAKMMHAEHGKNAA